MSNDSLKSSNCANELREAIKLEKLILTVVIRPQTDIKSFAPDDLKDFLNEKQYVNLSNGFKNSTNVAALYGAINELLAEFTYGNAIRSEANNTESLKEEEKVDLKSNSRGWNKAKTGDIFWLASDLTVAAPVAREGSPEIVKHYIRQTFWHVNQLELGELFDLRFQKLREVSNSYSQEDWNNPEMRQGLVNELSSLLHAIAFVMEAGDKDFKPNPPSDW